MAESAVQSAAAWLGKLVVEEAKYLYDVREKVEDLQVKLELMQCFLSDADKRQHKDAVIRKWISQIKDLAYDAEDVVEKFILRVSHKDRHRGFWSNLRWLSCLLRDASALHEIGTDIDRLTGKISNLTSSLKMCGVKTRNEEISASAADPRTLELRRTYSHFEDDMIVGIDDDIEWLAQQLVAFQHHRVVVISGMGGLGKTTLARKVYNHRDVRRHFVGFAWAHISQQFQTRSVIIGILLKITPETDTERRKEIRELQEEHLPGELFRVLKEKSYLVVLDDMWTTEDWLRLQAAFPVTDQSARSKILVTTRNRNILSGQVPGPSVLYREPQHLDADNSKKLLARKAWTTTEDSKMIELGENMLEHCQGLPLAIAVLGAALATKKTLEEWQIVNNNIRSFFRRGRDHSQSNSRVYDVLAMSYYNLPYYLKPCFLYLGNFPEDYEICTKKLYRMWIAEGIIASSSERTLRQSSLEEEAEKCLYELVQKCIVQVEKVESKEKIKTCRLHDLVRDVCLEIGKEENFICVIDLNQTNQDEPPPMLNERLRRLAIQGKEEADASLPDHSFEKAPNIRSLLFFPRQGWKKEHCSWIRSVCNNFQLLRVLDLNGFSIGGSLPKEIGNLIYLRFLSLKQTNFSKVPSSIAYLNCLETLDLRVVSYECVMLPNVLWKLQRLKHLYLPLRYKIKWGQMMRLDGLQYLETLKNVNLDRVESKGSNELRNLRKLTVSCVSKKKNLDLFLKSSSIEHLSLTIDGSIVSENPMILSNCQPLHHLSLRNNRIHGPLCPEMFPENLLIIELSNCEVENDPMPIFERLPQLKFLSLQECCGKNEMVCSPGGFPELTELVIINLSELREWKVEAGAFPKLKHILIFDSPNLVLPDMLPSDVEIYCNPCVKGIEKYKSCPHYLQQSE